MKRILALIMALALCATLVACGGAATPTEPPVQEADLSGTYDVTLWVSELDGVAALTQEQIDAFEAANPGIVINASIEGVTEADVSLEEKKVTVTAAEKVSIDALKAAVTKAGYQVI